MTSPCEFSSGPPELPGLMAGLVNVGAVGLLHLADAADDAARHGAVEDSKGIADGQHLLPHLQRAAAAQGDRLKVGSLDLDDGQVVRLVRADHRGRVVLLVLQDHFQLPRVVNHVVVGQDVAFVVNDEAGTRTLLRLRTEKEVVADDRGGDVDHRRHHAFVNVHVVLFFNVQGRCRLRLGNLHGGARDPAGRGAEAVGGVDEKCRGQQHSKQKRPKGFHGCLCAGSSGMT